MKIDIIYTYYNNNCDKSTILLNMYLDHWSNNFNNTKNNINFVIVDDHSPKRAIDTVVKANVNCNLQLFYVEDDIIWNEMGARNLGGSQTTSDIMLFVDWDHFIHEKLILDIFNFFRETTGKGICGRFYQSRPQYVSSNETEFLQYDHTSIPIAGNRIKKSCPSAFCFLRDSWEKIGPFDEDYAGAYGGYDRTFLEYIKRRKFKGRRVSQSPIIKLDEGQVKGVRREKTNRHLNKNVLVADSKGITRDSTTNKLVINKEFEDYRPPSDCIRFKWKKQYENIL